MFKPTFDSKPDGLVALQYIGLIRYREPLRIQRYILVEA